jgi:hypothetical protein
MMSDHDLDVWLRNTDTELRGMAKTMDLVLREAQGNSFAINAVANNLGEEFERLHREQKRTNAAIDGLHQDFTDFVEQDHRDKERLFAYNALLIVRSDIETRYGQYEDVRRNVYGMLLALDGGLAQDATTQYIGESQLINAPSYWLAAAMNALAAWIRNDRIAADRALLHAGKCSRGKTSLFFGLLNARFGRFEATDRWFDVYLNDQDPERLPREFTVVLHAAMLGLLGPITQHRVSRQCQAWFELLADREDVVTQQVERWRREIFQRCESTAAPAGAALDRQCRTLARVSPDWPRITGSYRQATAFGRTKTDLATGLDRSRVDQSAWQDRVDGVLLDLQRIYEPGEAELRQQEADYLRIIKFLGDTEAASKAKAAEAPLEEPLVDLLTLLSNAASHPPPDAPRETTQLALHLAKPWIRQAAAGLAAETRSLAAAPVSINFDGLSGQLGVDSVEALRGRFTTMVDGQTSKAIARERFAWPRLATAAAAVIAIGVMVSGLIAHRPFRAWPVYVPLACAALFVLLTIWRHRRIPGRIAKARQHGDRRKEAGLDALDAAADDRARLVAACNERISEADGLDEFVSLIDLPDLRSGLPGQPGTGVPSADPAQTSAVSAHSRGRDRLPTPFTLPEWSLEPPGPDRI